MQKSCGKMAKLGIIWKKHDIYNDFLILGLEDMVDSAPNKRFKIRSGHSDL